MEEMEEKELQMLQGTVERVVFRNEENGWTVLDLTVEEDMHKVVGVLPTVHAGEYLKLMGKWVEHPSFGIQFRAEHCEQQQPTGASEILRYLSSGAVKGVGPATAVHIVEKFGDETLRILEEEPERLAEVRGITPKRAEQIAADYAGQFGLRQVMMTFAGYGLTPNEALRCWKRWGAGTIQRIKENPYLLCSGGLYISFERADSICRAMQRPHDDPNRVEAGVLYVLRHNLGNGHTCLPERKLVPITAQLLEVEPELVTDVLRNMLATFTIKQELIHDETFLFLSHMHQAEKYAAARIRLIAGFPPEAHENMESRLDALEKNYGIHYEKQQRLAIREAIEKGALILTGGPGTGKTTTLKGIITLLESMGETVAIAAPTGRAAKRIAELTGCEAKTIHRLLEVQWDDADMPVFARNEKNPLDADALVVDEVSMVDVSLFESLLRALKSGCRLILVGDTDQLPAVGPGSVLQDLIDSAVLPVVQLTEVFRQAQESRIVTNAHRIVRGELPELGQKKGDFFFLPQTSARGVTQTILDLCNRRLPGSYGYTVFNGIQVLCPGRKGELGTRELNRRLQELLNPPSREKPEIAVEGTTLRVGDKIMHTKNNYDIVWTRDDGETGTGVFNGDIGVLEDLDAREGVLSVRFDDRVALYTKPEAQDLELAYAVTVHKSQGSEFEAVIMPVFHNQRPLCFRNLLYTAVTRAKSLLILAGDQATVAEMVNNNRKTLRYSGLRFFLEQSEGLFEETAL